MENISSKLIVETLWEQGKVTLPDPLNLKTTAYLDRARENIFDILIAADPPYKAEQVGFITVEKRPHGVYQIYSDRGHPLIESRRHYGIGVSPQYCNRGFGQTLLTLGIGVAQEDFYGRPSTRDFMIFGNEPTYDSQGMYKNAGFKPFKTDGKVSHVAYEDPNALPEINILMQPVKKQRSGFNAWWHALWTTY